MASNLIPVLIRTKVLRCLLALFVVLVFAARGQAKNNCPWMNEATASGLLGGDSVGEFTEASSGQPAVCTFTQKDSTVTRTLRVTVLVTPDFDAGYRSAGQAC